MRFSALQLLVLNALRTKRNATESAIARIIGADEDRVHVTLEILEGDDLIVAEKDGPETRFRLAQSYYDAIRADSPQGADGAKVMPSEEKVLRIAREQGHVSRSDIMSQLGISDHQAYYLLKSLTQKQKLRLEGKGRYAVYRAL
jgi:ATP-dependent DNA helicase RecG